MFCNIGRNLISTPSLKLLQSQHVKISNQNQLVRVASRSFHQNLLNLKDDKKVREVAKKDAKEVKPKAEHKPKEMIKDKAGFEKIKKLQDHFQKDDGIPVFLKMGKSDQILYKVTWGLIALGLAEFFVTMFQLMTK